jgi:drug/metabolite transporter (DMT)-like permease
VQSNHLKGITAILIAVIAFSVMDAMMKYLGETYSPLQVTALRGWSSLPFIMLMVTWMGGWRELKPKRWVMHIVRGLLSITMLVLFIYSLRTLSLSSAYAIFLCAPLLLTALSVWLLDEHVDWQRWTAIAVGLIGVIAMLRPDANEMISIGALAALGTAVCYAVSAIMIRTLARTETTLSISFSFLVVIAVAAALLAWPNWIALRADHWPWILTLGIAGTAGQYFIIEAFRHAPASVVAPFDYTALLWAAIFDWVLWSTLPESRMMGGAGIVIASGLYLIYRERVAARITIS